jgi:hypothetical protein
MEARAKCADKKRQQDDGKRHVQDCRWIFGITRSVQDASAVFGAALELGSVQRHAAQLRGRTLMRVVAPAAPQAAAGCSRC